MRNIIILSLLILTAGCGDIEKDYSLDEKAFDAGSLKMVEQCTGIKLPAGSRGLNMFYQGNQIDPSFVAKIQIPESSKDEISNRIERLHPQDGTVVNGSLTKKVSWWDPSLGTILIQRHSSLDGNYVRAILCQENAYLVLYLEWVTI